MQNKKNKLIDLRNKFQIKYNPGGKDGKIY